MLKINSSYSKKVPVPGLEMSSQSYHASVEVECSDGLSAEQLKERIHRTFQLVRQSVEEELHNNGGGELPADSHSQTGNNGSGNNGSGNNGNGKGKTNGEPVSDKQLRFLRNLGARNGFDSQQLNRMVHQKFGVKGVRQLKKKQASVLIDQLNDNTETANT